MLIGVGEDLPEVIDHLDQSAAISPEEWKEEDTSVADNLAAVQKIEEESREDEMDRYSESETVYGNEFEPDGRHKVLTGAQYAKSRQKILDKLAILQEIWDCHLGHFEMAKLCIELTTPAVHHIN